MHIAPSGPSVSPLHDDDHSTTLRVPASSLQKVRHTQDKHRNVFNVLTQPCQPKVKRKRPPCSINPSPGSHLPPVFPDIMFA